MAGQMSGKVFLKKIKAKAWLREKGESIFAAHSPVNADVAQLVERDLAKVEATSSNLVIRS